MSETDPATEFVVLGSEDVIHRFCLATVESRIPVRNIHGAPDPEALLGLIEKAPASIFGCILIDAASANDHSDDVLFAVGICAIVRLARERRPYACIVVTGLTERHQARVLEAGANVFVPNQALAGVIENPHTWDYLHERIRRHEDLVAKHHNDPTSTFAQTTVEWEPGPELNQTQQSGQR